ncbi:hypothetical protein C2845_PM15G17450 [Panicum miliaceum]|uniref:Uncharacterized protein n=1 Tax=Panicum miliaceum TaxID=4540 RepID=A0A3L6QAD8_PANMI|nr:hypothetical protein C2845_PM15G17450 [Panicum miliaceum]
MYVFLHSTEDLLEEQLPVCCLPLCLGARAAVKAPIRMHGGKSGPRAASSGGDAPIRAHGRPRRAGGGVPRGREPGAEVRLLLLEAAVLEVLRVAERVVVEAAGAEDGGAAEPVPAPRQAEVLPQPAPQRGGAEAAPAGGHRPARAVVVRVRVLLPVLAALLHRRQPPRRAKRPHRSSFSLPSARWGERASATSLARCVRSWLIGWLVVLGR